MNLQCLLHSCINVVVNCISTEKHLHGECPPWYEKSWDVAKKYSKLIRVHSGRGDYKLQIFAPCYHLQQVQFQIYK